MHLTERAAYHLPALRPLVGAATIPIIQVRKQSHGEVK